MQNNKTSTIGMSEKDKADCLIELHKELLGKYKQTRDIEFRINIALWTLIIIAGYSLKEIELTTLTKLVVFSFLYLLVTIFLSYAHFKFWLFPIQRSEYIDDYYIKKYRYNIELLTNKIIIKDPGEVKEILIFKDFSDRSKSWIKFEIGITIFLIIVVAIFIFINQI